MDKPIPITPAMHTALCRPLPNFHTLWQSYATSAFRRAHLAAWAGDDPEKQRVVQELLNDTTPSIIEKAPAPPHPDL